MLFVRLRTKKKNKITKYFTVPTLFFSYPHTEYVKLPAGVHPAIVKVVVLEYEVAVVVIVEVYQ